MADTDPTRPSSTVVVVEDDQLVRETLAEVLADDGYTPVVFDSGEAFLAGLPGIADRPHLLIVDVMLGGLDGFEVARRLRERWQDLPVVFISGDLRSLVRQSGPKDLSLMKPFTINTLRHVLAQAG